MLYTPLLHLHIVSNNWCPSPILCHSSPFLLPNPYSSPLSPIFPLHTDLWLPWRPCPPHWLRPSPGGWLRPHSGWRSGQRLSGWRLRAWTGQRCPSSRGSRSEREGWNSETMDSRWVIHMGSKETIWLEKTWFVVSLIFIFNIIYYKPWSS